MRALPHFFCQQQRMLQLSTSLTFCTYASPTAPSGKGKRSGDARYAATPAQRCAKQITSAAQ
jgi:hypothetical protein